MNEDLEFLVNLDERLRVNNEVRDGFYKGCHFDTYTHEKMSLTETRKVLKIAQGMNFVIYPINTAMGFAVGYDICEINPIGKKKVLLRFRESQLPKVYNFERMSEFFMSKANLAKAESIGKEIVNSHGHYDY